MSRGVAATRPPFRISAAPPSHPDLPQSTKEFHVDLPDAHYAAIGQSVLEYEQKYPKHDEDYFRAMANENLYVDCIKKVFFKKNLSPLGPRMRTRTKFGGRFFSKLWGRIWQTAPLRPSPTN